MDNKSKLKRQDLLYPELSYQIIGVLFEVCNELGYGYQEKYYQRAISSQLKKINLSFKEQAPVKVSFKGNEIGVYFLDFVIENKIVFRDKKWR